MCDNRINCGCDDCYDDDSMFSECLPFEQVTTVIPMSGVLENYIPISVDNFIQTV